MKGFPKRFARWFVSHPLMGLVGRRDMYRLSRFLLYQCRRDVHNDMEENGELLVQTVAVRHSEPGTTMMAFDVGANLGLWTGHLMTIAARCSRQVQVHAFEPCRETFEMLAQQIQKRGYTNVRAVRLACSSGPGKAMMKVLGAGVGANSITPSLDSRVVGEQEVELTSIDHYCQINDIQRINLMKVDAEGHDFEVLLGAARMLREHAIDVVQFEYNQRWIGARRYLRDVFELLQPLGYSMGKVTPGGIEFYAHWRWELETFVEGNYLACTPEWLGRFERLDPTWLPMDHMSRNGH